MDVRLLGAFELGAGRQLQGRLRTLLAVLAMSSTEHAALDRIAERVWGGELPDNPRRSLQTLVTRLRRQFGAAAIVTAGDSYLLDPAVVQVDALRFLDLLGPARNAVRETDRPRLDEALALWRGDPFDGVESGWLHRVMAPVLTERRLTAVERRADLDLAAGRHAQVTADLWPLTARHPLREPLWRRLLTALDGCGRRPDALAQYERIRAHLATELGAQPGPQLRAVHATLLADR